MRLIDADALEPDADYDDGEFWAVSMTQIENAPTIEPKKGRWIHVDRKKAYDRFCSECQKKCWYVGIGDYAFCPNCGADMRGEQNG